MLTPIKNILKINKNIVFVALATGCVALYISIVLYLSVWDDLERIALFPVLFVAICFIIFSLRTKVAAAKIQLTDDSPTFSSIFFYVTVFLIVFGGQLLYWFAYYPGGFNLDAYGQWDQVHGLQHLNNWHPVLTTAFYWLITRVYDSFAFCIFVQLLAFSASISYLLLVLHHLRIKDMLLIIAALYISLNPAIGMNDVCLFKDVPFTIAIIWVTTFLIKIIESDGEWINPLLHRVSLTAFLVVVALIRHNGIFYIIPLLICLLIMYKKQWRKPCSILLGFGVLLALIQGPLFSVLSVEQHSNFTGEAVGIPMATMANVYILDPENIPEDVETFLLSIATEEEWHKNYILGEWDSCKWEFGGTELFQDKSIKEFVPKFLTTIIASPDAAYQSIRENTRVVWQVFGNVEWDTWVYIEENDYGIMPSPNPLCSAMANKLLNLSLTLPGTALCWNIGVPTLMLVMIIWVSVVRKKYKNLLYIIPIISYNLLTMLLLCGPSHRYFYFNNVLFFPILLIMLSQLD